MDIQQLEFHSFVNESTTLTLSIEKIDSSTELPSLSVMMILVLPLSLCFPQWIRKSLLVVGCWFSCFLIAEVGVQIALTMLPQLMMKCLLSERQVQRSEPQDKHSSSSPEGSLLRVGPRLRYSIIVKLGYKNTVCV